MGLVLRVCGAREARGADCSVRVARNARCIMHLVGSKPTHAVPSQAIDTEGSMTIPGLLLSFECPAVQFLNTH